MKRFVIVSALLALAPLPAQAQSLFGTRGLGTPLPAVDARARSLGINGVGLWGLSNTMLNPAEAGGLFRRGVSASFQPWSGTADLNGESDEIGGTRFPAIQIYYPYRRFTLTLGYAGLLDQSWAIIADGRAPLGNDTVDVSDIVRSSGGIGEVRLGAAYFVSEQLSLGASVGLHTGNVLRSVTREYSDSSLYPFTSQQGWEYSGPTASVGMRWDPTRTIRVGASLSWSGTLDAEPDSGNAASQSYDLPLRLHGGISAQLSPRLLLAASASLANWSDGAYAAPGTSAQTVADKRVELGAGLEWSELRTATRVFPIRLGVRRSTLPFHNANESEVSEWAVSGGLGLMLAGDDFGPLAVADIGFEKGRREGLESTAAPGGLTENFWRATVTVSLFGR